MKIISIDGGGALGCGPAELLRLLENADGAQADVLTGTSVGALLVSLRASGKSWADISGIFDKWAGKIFETPPIWWRLDPTRPKFRDNGIRAAVLAELGDLRCCDAHIPFFIPVSDFATGRVKVYDITDTALLRDIVLGSTAAPTYFQPRDGRWSDGGLAANNPAMIAVCGAIDKLGAKLEDLRCLSLSTGGSYWLDPRVGRRTTKLGWAQPVIAFALGGTEELAEFQAAALLGERHLRIDPDLPREYPIDDPSICREYRRIWHAVWLRRKDEILKWSAGKRCHSAE